MNNTGGFLQVIGVAIIVSGLIAGSGLWPKGGYDYEMSVSEAQIEDLEALQKMLKTGIGFGASKVAMIKKAHAQKKVLASAVASLGLVFGLLFYGFGHLINLISSIAEHLKEVADRDKKPDVEEKQSIS